MLQAAGRLLKSSIARSPTLLYSATTTSSSSSSSLLLPSAVSASSSSAPFTFSRCFTNLVSQSQSSHVKPTASPSALSIPLTEPWPNTPPSIFIEPSSHLASSAKVTVLPNGLRVGSIHSIGHISAVGVFIHMGSRFEEGDDMGASHFLDSLSCMSTKNRTPEQLQHEADHLGSLPACFTTRENVLYHAVSFSNEIPLLLDLLADIVINPEITPEQVELTRSNILFELENSRDIQDRRMVDAFHETAFRGSKLANPLFCSHEVATNMKREDILLFRRKQVIAPRMMVGVVGPIDHGEVVKMVEKYFATLPSAPPTEQEMRVIKPSLKQKSTFSKLWTPSTPTVVSSSTSASTSSSTTTTLSQPVKPLTVQDIISSTPTTYTGGFHFMDYPVDNQTARTYIQILLGFKGVSCIDKELPILAILNVLMGGGNSFSVGGPGKGILSRLFTDVLNVYPFVENAICMSGNNYDTGFFGLHIMVPPKHAVDGLEIIVHELLRIPEDITEVQLSRARNQLKSMVLSSLETRPMALDDFMRQIMLSNEHIPVEQVCEKLDAITTADIKNFGAKLIKSKPTLVVMGPHQQYLPREPTEAFISRIFTSHSKTN